jgi:S-adenosylmethionine-diacylglycerol 3-amino-3-carboxypropyl transferase
VKLRSDLSPRAAAFWDANPDSIFNGIIHAGKFERYLRAFGQKVLPVIHAKWKRNALLFPRNTDEQVTFYDKHWNTWLWRSFFKVFFSRTSMGLLGRDPAFFDHVQGSVAEKILDRTRHAMTLLPTFSNPYLVYILTGNYMSIALPRYLRPEYKDAITARLDRITLHQGPIQEASTGTFDGFNLSDIFEYMGDKEYTQCYDRLLQRANPNARLAYWNMLVPRQAPNIHLDRVQSLDHLSRSLHFHDKAWFYQAFRVDNVKGL